MEGDDDYQLGRRIRAARALAGLSRAALAERIGVREGMVAKYEIGARIPGADRLERLSAVCGVPVEFFRADLDALAASAPDVSAQLSSIEDRLSRIEAELRVRRSAPR
jgi:transcriptional regulator with XRE-family HTH domain